MVADDAPMQQYAMAYCACKIEAGLPRDTSEVIGPCL